MDEQRTTAMPMLGQIGTMPVMPTANGTMPVMPTANGTMPVMPTANGTMPVMPTANINIEKTENGFICRVGCKTFVSQSWTEIASGLELYFNNPEEAMKKFLKK